MTNWSMLRRAGVIAACLGVTAAVGAAPALATTTQSEKIYANGSSLQKVAQLGGTNAAGTHWAGWMSTWATTPKDRPTLSCTPSASFPVPCTASYTSTSSGSGLAEFGNAGSSTSCPGSADAVLDLACDSSANNGSTNGYGVPVLDAFVGSDDPPNSTDLGNASTAATGGSGTTIHEITVPVAQAPVTIMLSLPAGLNVGQTSGKFGTIKLNTKLLLNIYDAGVGKSADYPARTWGALLEDAALKKVASNPTSTQFTDTGGAGNTAITLQARSSASGTSFTIKDFLNVAGDPNYTSTFVVDDPTWPVATEQCNEMPTSNCPFGANSGGGTLVKNTAAMPGSVGYANLADAAEAALGNDASCPPTTQFGFTNLAATINCVAGTTVAAHQVLYAQVQTDQGNATVRYASPQTGTPGVANVYTGSAVSINGSPGVGHWTVPESGGVLDPTGAWGGGPNDPDVYDHSGANGGTKVSQYPIVAGTYDLGWSSYTATGSNLVGDYGGTSAQAHAAGASANSYLTYETNPKSGQINLVGGHQYYAKLPSAIDSFAVTAAAAVTP